MAKVKSAYFCQNCGYETPKWLGKCPSCGEWNTFVEEVIEKNIPSVVAFSTSTRNSKPQAIHTIENQEHVRIELKDKSIQKVTLENEPNSLYNSIQKTKSSQFKLEDFIWRGNERPNSKEDLLKLRE